jgi:hypothetical protein
VARSGTPGKQYKEACKVREAADSEVMMNSFTSLKANGIEFDERHV